MFQDMSVYFVSSVRSKLLECCSQTKLNISCRIKCKIEIFYLTNAKIEQLTWQFKIEPALVVCNLAFTLPGSFSAITFDISQNWNSLKKYRCL